MSESVIQKRYRFNLDSSDPDDQALIDFLDVLDTLTVKERGAWLSRALSFYHKAMVTGAVPTTDPTHSRHALLAQTLAFQNGYAPAMPLAGVPHLSTRRGPLPTASESAWSHQHATPVTTSTTSREVAPRPAASASDERQQPTPENANNSTSPLKRALGNMM